MQIGKTFSCRIGGHIWGKRDAGGRSKCYRCGQTK